MKLKNLFIPIIISVIIITLPLNAYAEVLFGKAYYESLHKYLSQAKSSITIAMYFIILDPEDEEAPINVLVDDLIAAKERGVEVKVILEDSHLNACRHAYMKLRNNGVPVYFDMPDRLLHIKGIAIDDRYIFLGSANWSRSAIEDNYEASIFKDSPNDALALKEYINNISYQNKDIFTLDTSGVIIQPGFLLSPKGGRQLLKAQAFKQLDLYLLLCKKCRETKESQLNIDYDSLAKEMGYESPEDLGKYRDEHHYFYERIHRPLTRLKNYALLDYKKDVVSLKNEDLKIPDKPPIIIPFEYWEYGYPEKLTMRAKYMYLICLYEAARSTRYPSWFRSQKDMSALYGISDTTISLGLLELEEKGMIEITRSRKSPPDFSARKANVYRLLQLKE